MSDIRNKIVENMNKYKNARIARSRGYDIYEANGRLVAVSCLDVYEVEEVA